MERRKRKSVPEEGKVSIDAHDRCTVWSVEYAQEVFQVEKESTG
jgi:hypothetical protein